MFYTPVASKIYNICWTYVHWEFLKSMLSKFGSREIIDIKENNNNLCNRRAWLFECVNRLFSYGAQIKSEFPYTIRMPI